MILEEKVKKTKMILPLKCNYATHVLSVWRKTEDDLTTMDTDNPFLIKKIEALIQEKNAGIIDNIMLIASSKIIPAKSSGPGKIFPSIKVCTIFTCLLMKLNDLLYIIVIKIVAFVDS